MFAHACKMGLEGIVSKRKDSPYRSGRSPDWVKSKNPACAAVKREEEKIGDADGGPDLSHLRRPYCASNAPGAVARVIITFTS